MRNKKQSFLFNSLLLLMISSFFSCGNHESKSDSNSDNETSGKVNITVDEEFRPLFDSMITAFEGSYKNAKITVSYKPELDALKDLYSDSVRLVIVPHKLNAEELKYFESRGFTPKQTTVALDGIAFIVNPENPDSNIYREQLLDVLTGKITRWGKLRNNSFDGEITIITDNENSSAVRYLREEINLNAELPKNIYAAKGNEAVIDYVKKNKYSLGMIGVNWVSDLHDPKMLGFLKDIKVVATTAVNDSIKQLLSDQNYFWLKPQQSWILLKYYPFIRELNIINIEGKSGLGTGFSAYAMSEIGQLIVQHSGLLPANLSGRVIKFK